MNLAAMRQAVLDRGMLLPTDSAAQASLVNGYVNEALHWIETEEPNGWPWLWTSYAFNTVANQERYPFATVLPTAGMVKLVTVERTVPGSTSGPVPMKRFSKAAADQMYPFTLAQPPEIWYVEGQSLGLKPVCDAVYAISGTCVRVEADLAIDADTPIMPTIFHSAIVEKAAELVARHLMNFNKATDLGATYKAWIAQMRRYSREYVGPGRVQASVELERF